MVSLLEKLAMQTDAPSDEEDVTRNVSALAYVAGVDTVCYYSTFNIKSRSHLHHPDTALFGLNQLYTCYGCLPGSSAKGPS